jgi:hypothetical protein
MKQYVIDELRYPDFEKIKGYLDENFASSGVDGIYWIPVEVELLSDIQTAHVECQPFYFALQLEPQSLACEFLVRTQNRVRCNCIEYATQPQRNWLIQVVDAIFEKLEIKI